LASSINIGEVYYRLRKAGDEEGAEEFLHDLRGGVLPIEVVPATNRRVWAAAGLKARYAISYADAFAASLAAETGAPVVTGDPEFKSLAEDGIVQVKWLPQPGRAAPQRRT
jgi:predicted nucleic acid-binding protein